MRARVALIVLGSLAAGACARDWDQFSRVDTSGTASASSSASAGGGGQGTGATTTSGQGGSGGAACTKGQTIDCYTGPAGTEGVGVCVGGKKTCGADGVFGACAGEITPIPEDCATPADDDCNGQSNDPSICCKAPKEICGNTCVDTTSDPANCGKCQMQCPGAEMCIASSCAPALATSCKAELAMNPGSASKVYTIDPDGAGPDAAFDAFCEMSADGGGWTLVLKIDGTKNTFGYDAAIWTTPQPLNPASSALDLNEAKLESFSTIPFTDVRLGMIDGGVTRWIVVPFASTSLADTFSGPFAATSVGRAKWETLVASPSLQTTCNLEGFNVAPGIDATKDRARIGYIANENGDCMTPNSTIGFGTAGDSCLAADPQLACGNFAGCTADMGDRKTSTFGYVMVR